MNYCKTRWGRVYGCLQLLHKKLHYLKVEASYTMIIGEL